MHKITIQIKKHNFKYFIYKQITVYNPIQFEAVRMIFGITLK